ncbi:uncharacterized protein G2W53_006616 [Senna tora]|uniref:Uncharacterized protein n=1 Tax=Senna tora TaxID=362788 RepID=A0A834X500_9FABA|nr:uncharacterized protein G2W53_006616 [Senna tora]
MERNDPLPSRASKSTVIVARRAVVVGGAVGSASSSSLYGHKGVCLNPQMPITEAKSNLNANKDGPKLSFKGCTMPNKTQVSLDPVPIMIPNDAFNNKRFKVTPTRTIIV